MKHIMEQDAKISKLVEEKEGSSYKDDEEKNDDEMSQKQERREERKTDDKHFSDGFISIDQVKEFIVKDKFDVELAKLKNAKSVDSMSKQANDDHEAKLSMESKDGDKSPTNELEVSSDGSIHADQLKNFIMRTIKNKFEGTSKSSWTYSKPYTSRIESLKMPAGYQPPKFQQFDGKENPKQHMAHFVETCNGAGTYGDHMEKQFMHSLKDNAFDWYADLQSNFIDSWEQLEQEFLNRFYSTRRTDQRPNHKAKSPTLIYSILQHGLL